MSKGYSLGKFLTHATILLWLMFALQNLRGNLPNLFKTSEFKGGDAPLVMQGGDPHLRALMRTISMSESNYPNPYAIIHGGEYIQDYTQHPDHCTKITVGPNTGRCSTAAGRYQFLTTTWTEKSRIYHPLPSRFIVWERFSFEPQYQDAVMYAWLNDPEAWGTDLRVQLQQGAIEDVLARLSGTWTSLGYGIETNSMSAKLPELYSKFLKEELTAAANPSTNLTQQQTVPTPQL
jgi:muramidase (phage lysozyme)